CLRSDGKLPAEPLRDVATPRSQTACNNFRERIEEDVRMEETSELPRLRSDREEATTPGNGDGQEAEGGAREWPKPREETRKRQRRSEIEMTVDRDALVENKILDMNVTLTLWEILAI